LKEKENILKKFSKTIEMLVVHGHHAYVHGLCIMKNVYVHVLYREEGVYTSVNFQKEKGLDIQMGRENW
jgi:hypothetical protein